MPAEVSAGRSLTLLSMRSVTMDSNFTGSRSIEATWPTVTPPIFTGACLRSWPTWEKRAFRS